MKFPSLIFEIWCSHSFGTHRATYILIHSLIHSLTEGQTRLQNAEKRCLRYWLGKSVLLCLSLKERVGAMNEMIIFIFELYIWSCNLTNKQNKEVDVRPDNDVHSLSQYTLSVYSYVGKVQQRGNNWSAAGRILSKRHLSTVMCVISAQSCCSVARYGESLPIKVERHGNYDVVPHPKPKYVTT